MNIGAVILKKIMANGIIKSIERIIYKTTKWDLFHVCKAALTFKNQLMYPITSID